MKVQSAFSLFLVIFISMVCQVNAQKFVRGKFDPRWKTDTTKTIVKLKEIKSLLPGDGFEVFTNPDFILREEALNFYFRFEPVIAVEVDGEAKAYPLNVLSMKLPMMKLAISLLR